ncbi:MAG TPA: MBL fold metallo-hydrolase [Gammaproteobacteria bacterium]|nr:MBL fold metallo-hydrolase [Gammaproteobacteria bacterium]
MRGSFALFVSLLACLAVGGAAAQSKTFDIYWVDVEGGAATLVVSPTGESLLYDAGWQNDDRDAKRIFAAASAAGVSRIDHFVLSHFHADHAGGMVALSKLMPFGRCYDRGDFIEPENQKWRDAYLSVCKDRRTILKPGDRIPLAGVAVDVVASDGKLITKPLPGGGPNAECANVENHPKDVPENQLMVGALFTYGRFRFIDLADLDWEKELELVCPVNLIGRVSVWQAGRHGALDGAGAPGFLAAIEPQVVIVNNGPRKGWGGPTGAARERLTDHYKRVADVTPIDDVWQVHASLFAGARNVADERIANLTETDDQAHWLKVSVRADGTFTVTNGRTGYTKSYEAR